MFALSKIVHWFLDPVHFLLAVFLVGTLIRLLNRGIYARTGQLFQVAVLGAVLALFFLPMGSRMLEPLETRTHSIANRPQQACLQWRDLAVPVIAAIQGGALGAGVDLSSACDVRYCTSDAFFTIQEVNIGMVADVGTFPRVLRQLPDGLIRELAYTGRKLEAAEAFNRGFVNQVFETQDEMLAAVMEIARQIARNSPLAVAGSKHVMNYAAEQSTEDTLRYMQALNAGILSPAHMMESAAAKMQNREPVYPDLKAVNGPWD